MALPIFTPAMLNFGAGGLPSIERGMTFLVTLILEEAGKKALDLTGFTVEVYVEGVGLLTSGNGLTITVKEGKIVVELTPEQTEALTAGTQVNWYVKLKEGTKATPPVKGLIPVVNP